MAAWEGCGHQGTHPLSETHSSSLGLSGLQGSELLAGHLIHLPVTLGVPHLEAAPFPNRLRLCVCVGGGRGLVKWSLRQNQASTRGAQATKGTRSHLGPPSYVSTLRTGTQPEGESLLPQTAGMVCPQGLTGPWGSHGVSGGLWVQSRSGTRSSLQFYTRPISF